MKYDTKKRDLLEATSVRSRRISCTDESVETLDPVWVKPAVSSRATPRIVVGTPDALTLARKLAGDRIQEREIAVEEAYQRGLSEGKSQSDAAWEEIFSQMAQRLEQYAISIDGSIAKLTQDVATELPSLAMEIAKRAVATELRVSPVLVAAIAQEVCREIGDRSEVLLRLHPDDIHELEKYGIDLAAVCAVSTKLKLEASTSLTRGGCMAETPNGSYDAQIETRWRELERTVLQQSGETSERIDE